MPMDFLEIFRQLNGPLGASGALFVGVCYMMWQRIGDRQVTSADKAAQLQALEVYKTMLEEEREARKAAEDRAEQFARERNEALSQVWKLEGQMQAMAAQMEGLKEEIAALRTALGRPL